MTKRPALAPPPPGSAAGRAEVLEPRLLLASIAVTNTADAGGGSLRGAIEAANATPEADTIVFQLGTGDATTVHTIRPATPLPVITGPVLVDGRSLPGFADDRPRVEISGASISAAATDGLRFGNAVNAAVRGLIINRWTGSGVRVDGGSNFVLANSWIGLDAAGTAAAANGTGVTLANTADALIGGAGGASVRNVISGNTAAGVRSTATGTRVQGNYVGTTANGSAAVRNGRGVWVGGSSADASGNVVGGTAAGEGNLISGNTTGVQVSGSRAAGTVVAGNLIGSDPAGTAALPNGTGVHVENTRNVTVGGDTAASRNLISGNTGDGVALVASTDSVVRHNFVGTAADGRTAIGNFNGVRILDQDFMFPQGGNRVLDNVVSGNRQGVYLEAANGHFVQRNTIGLDAGRTAAVPNFELGGLGGTGVYVGLTSARNTIGGPARADGNVIAGNQRDGVIISTLSADNVVQNNSIGYVAGGFGFPPSVPVGNGRNGVMVGGSNQRILDNGIGFNGAAGVRIENGTPAILRNAMQNTGLGIDWRGDGVTPNDPGDADGLADGTLVQNFPVITSVETDAAEGVVSGTLNSLPGRRYHVELFGTATVDGSGHGEGQTYLGSAVVSTDAAGNASFTSALAPLTPGHWVTATATRMAGDVPVETSEFSASVVVPPRIDRGPRVSAVYVGALAWSGAFKRHLQARGLGDASYGYAVPAGPAQLAPLPWANVHQVSVRFNEPVDVGRDALAVTASKGAAASPGRYRVIGFSYNSGTRTGTWLLNANLGADRLQLRLASAGEFAVEDLAGNALDGEWSDGAGAFPSGNRTAGGDFVFSFNALPGDAGGGGAVNVSDLARVRAAYGSAVTSTGVATARYSPFADLDGSGRINATDLLIVRRQLRAVLPA